MRGTAAGAAGPPADLTTMITVVSTGARRTQGRTPTGVRRRELGCKLLRPGWDPDVAASRKEWSCWHLSPHPTQRPETRLVKRVCSTYRCSSPLRSTSRARSLRPPPGVLGVVATRSHSSSHSFERHLYGHDERPLAGLVADAIQLGLGLALLVEGKRLLSAFPVTGSLPIRRRICSASDLASG
jgi:hypothetical protein